MSLITIIHSTYGRGEVTATEANGFYLHVRFSDGRKRKVRRDQVEFEGNTAVTEPNTPVSDSSGNATKRKGPRYSRRIIESLRMGIVPDAEVARFTFGRDQEINALKAWLHDQNDCSRFIVGAYGTGKTHLLNYLRTTALQAGYAVALVEMDGLEAPFSRPKRVYSQVVQNLQVPIPEKQTRQRFRDFLRRVRREGLLGDHPYFRYIQPNTIDEHVWHWIEGREDVHRPRVAEADYLDLPGLYNFGTAANIYCSLLSGLGWACTQRQIGLKGLLLIFDEAEILFTRATYTASRSSYNFLEALVAVADNMTGMKEHPGTTGYTFAGYAENVPFQYRNPSGLKLALAFTDISNLRYSSTLHDVEVLYLDPLGDEALASVFEEILQLYQKAYRFSNQHLPLEDLYESVARKAETTRQKIKGFVEALDLMRFYPQSTPDELLV